jgi:hypothetical protein
MSEPVSITCPHCNAEIRIDTDAGVVIDHTAPVVYTEKTNFDTRLKELEEEKRRARDRMAEALRMEKSKEKIMEDRFQKLMEEARKSDDGRPPIRDIDLD